MHPGFALQIRASFDRYISDILILLTIILRDKPKFRDTIARHPAPADISLSLKRQLAAYAAKIRKGITMSFDDYKNSGYGEIAVGYGKKPGILVVDFQKSHISQEFPFGGRPLALRALENTLKLLSIARPLGIPVAVCFTAYQSERDMPYWKIRPVRDNYLPGNPAIELDERVADPQHDLVIRKTGPSMFYETKVEPFLTKAGVDTVIVTGVNTSGCIRATVIDSFQRGYRTIVPEDCVGDVEEGPHHDNLRDVERRYADVVNLESVRHYLESL